MENVTGEKTMSHKKIALWVCFILILILSTGCQETTLAPPLPTNTPKPLIPTNTPSIQTHDGIILGANANCPDRASFGQVTENVPARNVLVSSPINFRWYYAAAEGPAPDWANVCVPTSFTLYLSPGPDYSTYTTHTITPTSAENLVNLLMYSHVFTDTLQQHTSYRWMVVGHANGIDIGQERLPLFQDESAWKLINNSSQMSGQFQTGPGCDSQTISPVNLLNPQDGATLETDAPFFQWDMPQCSGSAYWLRFSTDPQMNSIDLGWATDHEGFLMFQGALQPCTLYHWQVMAGLNSLNYHLQMGNWETASEIRSFIIRSAACPNADAVPTATPTTTQTATPIPTSTPTKTPKPTSTPVVCADQPDQESCEAHGEICMWTQDLHGGFSCKSKP